MTRPIPFCCEVGVACGFVCVYVHYCRFRVWLMVFLSFLSRFVESYLRMLSLGASVADFRLKSVFLCPDFPFETLILRRGSAAARQRR